MSYQGKRPDQIRTSEKIAFFAYVGLITIVIILAVIALIK